MSEYYYLISSLPELTAGEEFQNHPYDVFHTFVREELSYSDYGSFLRCFLLNDVDNLVEMLENPSGDDETSWNSPSCYDREELEDSLQDTDNLPTFLADFIWDFRNGKRLYPQLKVKDELLRRMMDAVDAGTAEGMTGFTRDYLIFESHLRNLTTALSFREAGRPYTQHIIEFDHFSRQIAVSSAVDFGLRGELGLMSAPLEVFEGLKNPVDAEKAVVKTRWDWLDEQVDYRMFSSDAVFAYGIKIADVERWLRLTPETGRHRLDSLLERLHNDIRKKTQETAS